MGKNPPFIVIMKLFLYQVLNITVLNINCFISVSREE